MPLLIISVLHIDIIAVILYDIDELFLYNTLIHKIKGKYLYNVHKVIHNIVKPPNNGLPWSPKFFALFRRGKYLQSVNRFLLFVIA